MSISLTANSTTESAITTNGAESVVIDATKIKFNLPIVNSASAPYLSGTVAIANGGTGATTAATALTALGGASQAALASDTGASLIGFKQSGTGAVSRTLDAKAKETVSVKDFGAVGDGVTDDTAAIVAALATGKDVELTDATYRLAPAVVQVIADSGTQRLYGTGNTTLLIDLAASTDVFSFLGAVSLENLTIDFNTKSCRYAFKWAANAGNIVIRDLHLKNLKDTNNTAGSISLWIVETGNTFDISGVRFTSMKKRGDGSIAGDSGSLNLIYVGGGSGSTKGSIRNVYADTVQNIDAVDAVIYEDTAVIYVATTSTDTQNRILIQNIQGVNFGKRLLKIHASNVTVNDVFGYSTEGDSLGVLGFLNAQGLGEKYGCSASNIRAIGLMEYAVFNDAPSVRYEQIYASVQPGNKAGMLASATGLYISNDETIVNGFWSDSQRCISIGNSTKALKNISLSNINVVINATSAAGAVIHNTSDTLGFDGLSIDGIYATSSATAPQTSVLNFATYLNGTTKKGRNLIVRNAKIATQGALNSQFITAQYNENVSIQTVKYINTSGLSHFRVLEILNCVNVHIDDVVIEGTNQLGVMLHTCTGRNTIGRVLNPSASIAAVYNQSSTDVWVYGCSHAQVSGNTANNSQNTKQTVNTTASRPTLGLVAGFSQHFDTTLVKPIWWTGTVWVDATGATV